MPSLLAGINVYQGELVHEGIAAALGRELDSNLLAEHIAKNKAEQGRQKGR
jgi:alanine dehydrogenase